MAKKILIILEIAVLLFFLYWHFKLGLVRYFDADEFAHLHWGYSFSIGEKPYTDFFYLFPPFFLYPIAAIFKIIGRNIQAIMAARMFIFFIFLSTCSVLFFLIKRLRNVQTALLAVLIFAFLPLPFDKLIEVRPDLAATFFSLLGMWCFMKGTENCHSRVYPVRESGNLYGSPIKSGMTSRLVTGMTNRLVISSNKGSKWFFLSGLSYAVGLGFVPKTVFFLVPVVLVFGYRLLKGIKLSLRVHSQAQCKLREAIPSGSPRSDVTLGLAMTSFLLGFVFIGLLLFVMISSFGNIQLSIYSMTKMAAEVTRVLGAKFYMRPDIFFYPNDTYYGFGGWSWPIILNLIIYVSASIWAIRNILTFNLWRDEPSVAKASEGKGDKGHDYIGEFLTAGSFWANLAAFVFIYPLKHSQYLIPVAPFIAFYFADLLLSRLLPFSQNGFLERFYNAKFLGKSFGNFSSRFPFRNLATKSNPTAQILLESAKALPIFLLVIILLLISVIGSRMNQKKEKWVNNPVLEKIYSYLKTIPANAPVWDLTGESIFFKNGYYFCCLPYGQYEEALYFKIPDIEKEMKKRETKYVHVGEGGRLDQIPVSHAKYVKENFIPEISDKALWVKKTN